MHWTVTAHKAAMGLPWRHRVHRSRGLEAGNMKGGSGPVALAGYGHLQVFQGEPLAF